MQKQDVKFYFSCNCLSSFLHKVKLSNSWYSKLKVMFNMTKSKVLLETIEILKLRSITDPVTTEFVKW